MSKYDKLWQYIQEHDLDVITFEEIESILGFKINHSFLNYKKRIK